jgi:hypothetical protein
MAKVVAYCEVDDVDLWLKSARRAEVLTPLGITGRLFADPAGSNRVAIHGDVPDMDALQTFMRSSTAAEAMRADGVHIESLVLLVEAADHL